MALQGDLKSFALPDVLRLLAGTDKSGRLEVGGADVSGELSLRSGAIASGAVSSAPTAEAPADVLYELLRLDDGSFTFDEGEQPGDGPVVTVDDALAEAAALLAEWEDVRTVVPSMDAWISLATEIEVDSVKVSANQWRAVAAVAGGANVRELAALLEQSDLAASQTVKGLADGGLVAVRAAAGFRTPTIELDSFEQFENAAGANGSDLEDLVAEDRPVVMEERDDALLPEPLPGEGVAYEGEDITGVVDGRTVDPAETSTLVEVADVAPLEEDISFAQILDEGLMADEATIAADEFVADQDDALLDDDGDEATEETSGDSTDPLTDESTDEIDGAAATEGDDERGSLLRFLSSVKP